LRPLPCAKAEPATSVKTAIVTAALRNMGSVPPPDTGQEPDHAFSGLFIKNVGPDVIREGRSTAQPAVQKR
jgi:hypothetical protein